MVIMSLVIILLIVIVAAIVSVAEYKIVKRQERQEKRKLKYEDDLDTNYKLFLKEIREICVEALQVNDYRNCKEHYKEIISYIDKIL